MKLYLKIIFFVMFVIILIILYFSLNKNNISSIQYNFKGELDSSDYFLENNNLFVLKKDVVSMAVHFQEIDGNSESGVKYTNHIKIIDFQEIRIGLKKYFVIDLNKYNYDCNSLNLKEPVSLIFLTYKSKKNVIFQKSIFIFSKDINLVCN
jgi:hypothetical protein